MGRPKDKAPQQVRHVLLQIVQVLEKENIEYVSVADLRRIAEGGTK